MVEETFDEITYELQTIYLWILYGILIVGGIGLSLKEPILGIVAGGSLLFYEIRCNRDRHDDWRYDQFIGMVGSFRHEIEWGDGSVWIIEADELEYGWSDKSQRI